MVISRILDRDEIGHWHGDQVNLLRLLVLELLLQALDIEAY